MRVLIVDDDNYIRGLLRALLEREGMECHEAEDGLEALAAARRLHPDVMILDVMLPGLDGYKVCQMIKYDEEFSDIAVIMVTSLSTAADKETGYYTGADIFLTKPFDHRELLGAVEQLMGSRTAG
jgi:putative two-component system response regulator